MSEYKEELKCSKCGKSPARRIELFDSNICEEHQKELSKFINNQLGESED